MKLLTNCFANTVCQTGSVSGATAIPGRSYSVEPPERFQIFLVGPTQETIKFPLGAVISDEYSWALREYQRSLDVRSNSTRTVKEGYILSRDTSEHSRRTFYALVSSCC